MKVDSRKQANANILILLSLAGLLVISGCASTGPSATLPLARSFLETSQEDRLSEFAPLELRIAQDKVEEAEQAAKAKDHNKAERLSQEALANLKLAEAKAAAKKSQTIAEELERAISTLRQEINR